MGCMAICDYCEQEMRVAPSCVVTELHVDGRDYPLPRWGAERGWGRPNGRCGDCGVQPGGAHHLGCDIAECPRCRGQLLSCGCRFDEDPPEDDEELDEELTDGSLADLLAQWAAR